MERKQGRSGADRSQRAMPNGNSAAALPCQRLRSRQVIHSPRECVSRQPRRREAKSRRVLVYIRRKGHSGFDDEPARTVSCRRDGNTCSIVFASNLTTYTFASRNVAICTEDGAVDGAEFDFLIKDGIANTPLPPVRRATHFRSDNPEFEDRISPLPSGGRELIYPQSALVIPKCSWIRT